MTPRLSPQEKERRRFARFWRHVEKDGGCWLWTGTKNNAGYGQAHWSGRHVLAHRASWEMHNGPAPAGMHICHRCDVRLCVRPDHLFLGTPDDNVQDMIAKGRMSTGRAHGDKTRGALNGSRLHPDRLARGDRNGSRLHPESRPRGEACGSSKLTTAQVIAIRADRRKHQEIANDYGLARLTVLRIKKGRAWAHVAMGAGQ
jgi:hypothetical protein